MAAVCAAFFELFVTRRFEYRCGISDVIQCVAMNIFTDDVRVLVYIGLININCTGKL